MIGLALERKTISNNFHSKAYPSFFKSSGPFRVYDHAQAKGKNYVNNIMSINQQAAERFQNEC